MVQTSIPHLGEVLWGGVDGRLVLGACRSTDLAAFGALAVVVAAEVTTTAWSFVPWLRLRGGAVSSDLTVEFLGVFLELLLLALVSGSSGWPWWQGVERLWQRSCNWGQFWCSASSLLLRPAVLAWGGVCGC